MTKTITFAITHFSVAFTVVWLMTGDLLISSLAAIIEPAVNTVAYHIHEKIWERRRARQAAQQEQAPLAPESRVCIS